MAQSNSTPAKRKGNGPGRGGDARGYAWEPFREGSTVSIRHGLYSGRFAPLEKVEIDQTAELLRSILPTYASAFEPALQLLAACLWRLRCGYEFVEKTPEGELPEAFLRNPQQPRAPGQPQPGFARRDADRGQRIGSQFGALGRWQR